MSLPTSGGVNANATINGVHTTTPAESWDLQTRWLKSVQMLAAGKYREGWTYVGPSRESNPRETTIVIAWSALGNRRLIAELIGPPGPHQIALWRGESLSYAGNGVRTEFELPWLSAVDTAAWSTDPGGMPDGRPVSSFSPSVNVGVSGTELTFEQKTEAAYDAGSPASDEVWFKEGTKLFKVLTAPTESQTLFAWIAPIYPVFVGSGVQDVKLRAATHEPYNLTLVEAAT